MPKFTSGHASTRGLSPIQRSVIAAIAAAAALLVCLAAARADWRASTRLVPVQTQEAPQPACEGSNCHHNGQCTQSVVWQQERTPVAWRDCYEACVRIHRQGAAGSGAVFHIDQQYCWILTNAHVVGSSQQVSVEFFKQGFKSSPMTGTVSYSRLVEPNLDIAIVLVPRAPFGSSPPKSIPLGRDPVAGESFISVGCPQADWPSLWYGHVVATDGNTIRFTPGPHRLPDGGNMMSGRSGSVLCSPDGTEIRGLIAWSDRANGIAQRISFVQRATMADTTQCGPGGCPWNRQPPQPQYPQYPQQPPGGNPWPQLPPEGGALPPQVNATQLADFQERLSNLERDRAEFAREWSRIKSIATQVEQDLPQLRKFVQESGDEQLQQAAEYAERLVQTSVRRIDQVEAEVEKASGIKGLVTEQISEVRAELKGYLGELLSVKNALDVVQRYRDNRASNPEGTAVDAIRLTLRDELGLIKEHLAGYGQSKFGEAKEAAVEDVLPLAIKWLPWPIGTALTAALWILRRRRDPDPTPAPSSAKAV